VHEVDVAYQEVKLEDVVGWKQPQNLLAQKIHVHVEAQQIHETQSAQRKKPGELMVQNQAPVSGQLAT